MEHWATIRKLDLPTFNDLVIEARHEDPLIALCVAAGFKITGKLGIGGLVRIVEGGLLRKGKLAYGYEPDLDEL